jgi:hypothetical protein
MRTRKKVEERFPLRIEIENDVAAFNKHLKKRVRCMSLYVLLCNCHPLYRANHARNLLKDGYIDENTAKEFTAKQPLIEII